MLQSYKLLLSDILSTIVTYSTCVFINHIIYLEMSNSTESNDVPLINEFTNFFQNLRQSGKSPSPDEIIRFSKLFTDELTLDNMSHAQLRVRIYIESTSHIYNTISSQPDLLKIIKLLFDSKRGLRILRYGVLRFRRWEIISALCHRYEIYCILILILF